MWRVVKRQLSLQGENAYQGRKQHNQQPAIASLP